MSATTYAWLVLAFPLAGFLINAFGWRVLPGRAAGWIGTAAAYPLFVTQKAAMYIDVTSVLVASAIVTLVLQSVVQHKGLGPEVLGIALMATGTALVAGNWKRVVRA